MYSSLPRTVSYLSSTLSPSSSPYSYPLPDPTIRIFNDLSDGIHITEDFTNEEEEEFYDEDEEEANILMMENIKAGLREARLYIENLHNRLGDYA